MTALPNHTGLRPGLPDPVLDSQRIFRVILTAMSHPGTIVDVTLPLSPPLPLDVATAAVTLTLTDYETPLWLEKASAATAEYFRFHCGCPITDTPDAAAFAIITAPTEMPPLAMFQAGSDEYPDRSTTAIIQVPSLSGGETWLLSGPGIPNSRAFAPAGLPAAFPDWLRDNHGLFPRGIDLIFTCGTALAALPRSTQLES